ncbi:hypothetical protein [Streptomyces sp. NPDC017520]|uniref:hypothetical protein n=1 Tax=Streptomyces sp. NPDC017520 TaxID=3364998 RepID=UPI0037B02D6E
MSGGEVSGVDLARQALLAAREAARKNGATRQKPKRRTTTVVRRDGREPLGLGSAIGVMMTERGMAAPAAGGNVLADFDTILTAVAPELAGRVTAVAFDSDTGRLDVAPRHPPLCLGGPGHRGVHGGRDRVAGGTAFGLPVLAARAVLAGVEQRALIAPDFRTQPGLRQAPADQPAHRVRGRTAQPHLAFQAPGEPVGEDLRRVGGTGEPDQPGQLCTDSRLHQPPGGRTLVSAADFDPSWPRGSLVGDTR